MEFIIKRRHLWRVETILDIITYDLTQLLYKTLVPFGIEGFIYEKLALIKHGFKVNITQHIFTMASHTQSV